MEYTIIVLLIIGIAILVFSFRKEKDQVNDLEQKLENFSISVLKELHQVQDMINDKKGK
ncbi:hypothetical protein [Aneurinibacillus terranovensis]|uniref:hypothetical protein n=1 Tax=Aneurinibacillus terranovensis TaxID=278991 RepID=UPI00041A8786|nr:hypothetical protein [Aneurinibacillus terranovensis]